jgi:hypothetical protein
MISERDVPRRVTHWNDKSILMCDRTDLLNLANYLAHFLAVRGLKAPGVRLSDLNTPPKAPRLAHTATAAPDDIGDGPD